MPIYVYQCPNCGVIIEEIKNTKKIDDAPKCGHCSKNVETKRIMSAGTFKIKGFSEANGYSQNKG